MTKDTSDDYFSSCWDPLAEGECFSSLLLLVVTTAESACMVELSSLSEARDTGAVTSVFAFATILTPQLDTAEGSSTWSILIRFVPSPRVPHHFTILDR